MDKMSNVKKKNKFILWPLGVTLGLILIIYFGMAAFYGGFTKDYSKHRFIFGTWVNGIYATGMNCEELNEILTKDDDIGMFTIISHQGLECYLPLSDIGYSTDYTSTLQTMIAAQNPFLWVMGIPQGMNYISDPEYSYDKELVKAGVLSSKLFEDGLADQNEAIVELAYSKEDGFWLFENTQDSINSKNTIEDVENALLNGEQSFTLDAGDLNKRKISSSDLETYALWKKIEDIQNIDIAYDMGDKTVHFDGAEMAKWITDENGKILLDDEGNIYYNEDCVEDFIDRLIEEYDTYGKPREFKTTRGDVVTISNNLVGTKIDRNAEIKYLSEALKEGRHEVRVPIYLKSTGVRGVDDIGDTYVEVDKDNQQMYYYIDGELFISTPVVTGNVSSAHQTPSMVCPIVSKERDRYLIGPGYCSFVHYWMHIHNGIGIHDAMWRDEFGGELYKTSGSHGCINTPDDAMIKMFENIEIGTIVIIY